MIFSNENYHIIWPSHVKEMHVIHKKILNLGSGTIGLQITKGYCSSNKDLVCDMHTYGQFFKFYNRNWPSKWYGLLHLFVPFPRYRGLKVAKICWVSIFSDFSLNLNLDILGMARPNVVTNTIFWTCFPSSF